MCSRLIILVSTFYFSVGLAVFIYNFTDLQLHFFPSKAEIVETKNGKLEGIIQKSRDGKEYLAYLGIPYAQPPVGDLRFETPLPATPWDGVRASNKFGPDCHQYAVLTTGRILGSEDCLYLNVYTPKLQGKLPVMVWFHGGGFLEGSGRIYSPKYFMDHDILIVTLNYRLGAFGFLNTGDDVIKGNMGLKDQNLALKWVKNNIERFGGDPNRVTIFGESAGGASVNYHILSPLSKGLFHRAISQSGVAQCPWAFTRNAANQAKYFGKKVKCPTESTEELVNCLKNMNPKDLVLPNFKKFDPFILQDDMLVGSLENKKSDEPFLTEYPYDILKNGKFAQVPLMIGVVAGEGGLKTSRIQAMSSEEDVDKKWNSIAPLLMHYDPKRVKDTKQIREFYLGKNKFQKNPSDFLKNVTTMLSDGLFFHPTVMTATMHAHKAPVYLYYYDYKAFTPSMYSIMRSLKPDTWLLSELKFLISAIVDMYSKYMEMPGPHDYGACHADDLLQLWLVNPLLEVRNGYPDIEFSKKLVKTFVDFAHGDAKSKLKFDGVQWPLANPDENLKYMYLGESPRIVTDPFKGRISFLNALQLWDPVGKINW